MAVLAFFAALSMGCPGATEDAAPWQDLINGSDLSGWTQLGGTAEFY